MHYFQVSHKILLKYIDFSCSTLAKYGMVKGCEYLNNTHSETIKKTKQPRHLLVFLPCSFWTTSGRKTGKTGILSLSLPIFLYPLTDRPPPFPSSSPPPHCPLAQTLSESGAGNLGGGVGPMHTLSPPHAPATAWDARRWGKGQPGGVVHCEWTRRGQGGQRRRGDGGGSSDSGADRSWSSGGGGDGKRER